MVASWLILFSAQAWRAPPLRAAGRTAPPPRWPALRSARASVCCSADADVPSDIVSICGEACEAVRGDLLRGKRGLRVDVGLPALDPCGRMYEPKVLARACLELSRTLTLLDGRVLLLLPGFATSGAAMELLEDEELEWPAEFRGRLEISALELRRPPSDDAELPAAVVVAGLSPAASSDDASFRNGRAWLSRASSGCAILCFNIECKYEPIELNEFAHSYAFVSYGITRTAANERGEKEGAPESSGVALLRRTSPGPWRLLFDPAGLGGGGEQYRTLSETAARPSDEAMERLVQEAVERHREGSAGGPPRSAVDSLEAAFRLEVGAPQPPAARAAPTAAPTAAPAAAPTAPAAPASPADADGAGSTRALAWGALQDAGRGGALKVYQAEALLRCAALGAAADFDADAQALHCLAGVARKANVGFAVGAACLLVRDDGAGRLEQLCVKAGGDPEQRAQLARDVLATAEAEARKLGLAELKVGAAMTEALGADEAGWLAAAGFVSADGAASFCKPLL